jgi:hypothetical protein
MPKDAVALALTMPPLMVVPPEYVLVSLMVRVPDPVLLRAVIQPIEPVPPKV